MDTFLFIIITHSFADASHQIYIHANEQQQPAAAATAEKQNDDKPNDHHILQANWL